MARCRGDEDRIEQRDRLRALGVSQQRIYLDNSLTAFSGQRPGLDQVLAAVRPGDTLVAISLARLARSIADASWLAGTLADNRIALSLNSVVHDPTDPVGAMFFTTLGTVGDCETELRTLRAVQGMATARAQGRLRGRQPKLTVKQRRELQWLHDTGDYTVGDLAEIFRVSRPTVYRMLRRPNRG
jgi:DNA invertase Pin-like site-specific DNA recombinase